MSLISPQELLKHTKCPQCPLSAKGCPKPGKLLHSRGTERARIVVVGESPTTKDLGRKKVFSGESGNLINSILSALNIPYEDIYWANALLCNYPAGAKPSPAACNDRLVKELQGLPRARVIIAMGTLALQALVPGTKSVTKEMYKVFWHERLNAFVIPTYHPGFAYKDVEAFPDIVWAFERALSLLDKPKTVLDPPPIVKRIARNHGEAVALLREIADIDRPTWVTIDWESDNLQVADAATLAIGFCYRKNEAIIIPWACRPAAKPDPMDLPPTPEMISELYRIANNPYLRFNFHNGDFDVQLTYYNTGVRFRIDYDTMLSDYALDERGGSDSLEGIGGGVKIGSHRLKSSAMRYLHVPDWEGDIKIWLKNKKTPYSHIPRPKLYTYLGYDVCHTDALREKHIELLNASEPSRNHAKGWWGPSETVTRLLVPALNEIISSEIEGVAVNRLQASVLYDLMGEELEDLKQKIREQALNEGWPANKPFNHRSNQHLKTLIYDIMKVPLTADLRRQLDGKPIKTAYPTGKDVLTRLRPRSPIFELILKHKALDKRRSTYILSVIEKAERDGNIHPSLKLTVTRTGRLSSKDPNVQNIDPPSKVLYEPDEDCVLVNADYRQLEVRVAAFFSRDPLLIEACRGDIHGTISREIFAHIYAEIAGASGNLRALAEIAAAHTVLDPVLRKHISEPFASAPKLEKALKKRLRDAAKPIIFGVLYGREAYSLANGPLACSELEAQRYIDNLFTRFSKLAAWLEEQKQLVIDEGWLECPTGRRRRFPFLHNEYISRALKQAVNAPVQGFASDICLTAFTNVAPKLRELGYGRALFLVHDAITYSLRLETLKPALRLIKQEMEGAYTDPDIVFAIEVSVGPNYGEQTEIEDLDTYCDSPWPVLRPRTASRLRLPYAV